ncbi:MAG: hypothetical protein LBG79_07455 [Spirochaetaceae bacterium]|nr:hypothetical protein [Spirochaetaceae bacterium]GMO29581.1 MAG: trehalase family glycosidase [Termitinemataceae bacterium]
MSKRDFPRIHFYDQDFVDIYDRTWAWVQDCWDKGPENSAITGKFFSYPESETLTQMDAIFSSFFLVYSNRIFQANPTLDVFYGRQEESGAIRGAYNIKSGASICGEDNPHGIGIPLFAWAEFNLYHKAANKKRIKEVLPILDRYNNWIDSEFKNENGLYEVPVTATGMFNAPREDAVYLVDFNAMMAINVLYMAAIADILNDKDSGFRYKKQYFSLKTRINSLMWDPGDGFYYDLDKNGKRIKIKTIAAYWTLLAEIPNEDKAAQLVEKLKLPDVFGTAHPFPSVAANEKVFSESGDGYRGSVFPHLNFMVIKGLERYQQWDLARESAIRHLYFILDSMQENESGVKGSLYEAYKPLKEGKSEWSCEPPANWSFFPRNQYFTFVALSTICLTVENIVGLTISLPRKTVDWIIPNMEIMGIENLSLKKNLITIRSIKSVRGWEINLESEKLYYFTINILNQKKKKTLPIPSGKCSMLVDKL